MTSAGGVLSTVLGTRLRMSLGIRATCAPSGAPAGDPIVRRQHAGHARERRTRRSSIGVAHSSLSGERSLAAAGDRCRSGQRTPMQTFRCKACGCRDRLSWSGSRRSSRPAPGPWRAGPGWPADRCRARPHWRRDPAAGGRAGGCGPSAGHPGRGSSRPARRRSRPVADIGCGRLQALGYPLTSASPVA